MARFKAHRVFLARSDDPILEVWQGDQHLLTLTVMGRGRVSIVLEEVSLAPAPQILRRTSDALAFGFAMLVKGYGPDVLLYEPMDDDDLIEES